MWIDIYLLRTSGWLKCSRNRNPNPTLTQPYAYIIKKVNIWLKFLFESYFEVDDDVWDKRGCISDDCDSYVYDDNFLRGWQAGAKNVFGCRIVGLCRSV